MLRIQAAGQQDDFVIAKPLCRSQHDNPSPFSELLFSCRYMVRLQRIEGYCPLGQFSTRVLGQPIRGAQFRGKAIFAYENCEDLKDAESKTEPSLQFDSD